MDLLLGVGQPMGLGGEGWSLLRRGLSSPAIPAAKLDPFRGAASCPHPEEPGGGPQGAGKTFTVRSFQSFLKDRTTLATPFPAPNLHGD